MSQYEQTLHHMTTLFEAQGRCVVEEGSDLSIKLMVVASEISALFDKLEFYEKQIFPHTADGEYLKKHGEAKGIFKKTASKSIGTVTFKAKTAPSSPITIPQGTMVASSKVEDATYQTTADAVLQAPSLFTMVPVESTTAGRDTAIAPRMVDILVTPISGIIEVTNNAKISGGADQEPDELYKNRVIESYTKISNGANLNYYEQLAKTVDDVWYAKAVYSTSPSNKISVYIQNYTRTINDSAVANVQTKLNSARTVGINVEVQRPVKKTVSVTMTIKVDNLANQSQYIYNVQAAVMEYISELSIGESVSLSQMGARVLAVAGIIDANITAPSGVVAINSNEIADIGTMNITATA